MGNVDRSGRQHRSRLTGPTRCAGLVAAQQLPQVLRTILVGLQSGVFYYQSDGVTDGHGRPLVQSRCEGGRGVDLFEQLRGELSLQAPSFRASPTITRGVNFALS
jgi:hypothetical protein